VSARAIISIIAGLALSGGTAVAAPPAGDGPRTIVAIGDGLVAGPPTSAAKPVAGGWVPSLADCLEERAPGRFALVDRAAPGETAATARERLAAVKKLAPAMVVMSLGAQELADPDTTSEALRTDLQQLAAEVGDTQVLLVGLVAPTLTQTAYADVNRQRRADERTTEFNAAVADLAKASDRLVHVDLWRDWPRDAARADLTQKGWSLSEQGHARVAAAVCDAVVAGPEAEPAGAAAPSPP